MELEDLHLAFSGRLVHWRGPSPYHFVPVPDGAAELLRSIAPLVTYGWGVIPVVVRIGATEFTTSLFPKAGGYLVPVKDVARRAEGLALGDEVALELRVGRPR